MNEYNEKWTREKFVEYRKLKKDGYTHDMLKEHFGDDIWYSGLYNKNSCTLPHIIKYAHFVNEIKVNPEETDYNYMKMPSVFFKNETDYVISFYSNDLPYIIALMYFPINDIETYNIVFTTSVQWNEYNFKLKTFKRKGHITDEEYEILNKIISKETKLNDLYSILKKISWILLDFYMTNLVDKKLSIGDTENEKKIKLYRNIIENSFTNIIEKEESFSNHKYYIYEIK
jgi:hypothetical protein